MVPGIYNSDWVDGIEMCISVVVDFHNFGVMICFLDDNILVRS